MELISENNGGMELMNKINSIIRGGSSVIAQPFAKANNWAVLPALPEGPHVLRARLC